jgi:hypothetical protein
VSQRLCSNAPPPRFDVWSFRVQLFTWTSCFTITEMVSSQRCVSNSVSNSVSHMLCGLGPSPYHAWPNRCVAVHVESLRLYSCGTPLFRPTLVFLTRVIYWVRPSYGSSNTCFRGSHVLCTHRRFFLQRTKLELYFFLLNSHPQTQVRRHGPCWRRTVLSDLQRRDAVLTRCVTLVTLCHFILERELRLLHCLPTSLSSYVVVPVSVSVLHSCCRPSCCSSYRCRSRHRFQSLVLFPFVVFTCDFVPQPHLPV